MTTVLITGANRGIGLEMARRYHARGAQVIATCRTASAALRELDVRVEEGVDVSDDALGGLPSRLGEIAIDVLINNAGILRHDDLSPLDVDSMRQQFEVNTLGPLRTTSALRDNLKSGSKVALITSRMGSIADNTSGGRYGYRMSKAALNIAGVSMALDLAPEGISVAILHPGFVRTGMTGGAGFIEADEAAQGLIARIDALTPETSGTFWHANGENLPW